MSPVSLIPAVAAVLLALLMSQVLVWRVGAPPALGRFTSIDGLRGYLAFFVFVHHACVWYFYLHNGQWQVPPSHAYTHFGQSSVALFFMITGFLFWSKLLDGKLKGINWLRLYQSRLVRLVPLYLLVLSLLLLIVAIRSSFVWKQPWATQLRPLLSWLLFTAGGAADLNGVEKTRYIVAGVTWSLPYEWLFYLLLPLVGWRMKIPMPRLILLLGVGGLLWWYSWRPDRLSMLFFLGGINAAYWVRRERFCDWARGTPASLLALAALLLVIVSFDGLYDLPGKWLKYLPLLLLSLVFAIIAGGNTLFGLLQLPVSRMLGEISYSIYLLHGMLLYVTFELVLGRVWVSSLSPLQFWGVLLALVPLLVLLCYLTFRLVEMPPMHWLKRRHASRAAAAPIMMQATSQAGQL